MQPELEEVFVWLEAGAGADYQAGVLLLQKHSKNRSLTNGLLKKESDANRDKLVYELVKVGCGGRMQDVNEVLNHFAQAATLALSNVAGHLGIVKDQVVAFTQTVNQAVVALVDEAASGGAAVIPEPKHVPAHLRTELDELTLLMNKAYQQRCQLSNSLATLDPAEGPTVVAQILVLEEEYNTLAQKCRSLEGGEPPVPEQLAPGIEPVPTVMPGIDRAALLQQRGNLRSRISKARKAAAEAKTAAKRSEQEQKAGYLAVELTMVDSQLQLPQAPA